MLVRGELGPDTDSGGEGLVAICMDVDVAGGSRKEW